MSQAAVNISVIDDTAVDCVVGAAVNCIPPSFEGGLLKGAYFLTVRIDTEPRPL
jgi:hypothetical protein